MHFNANKQVLNAHFVGELIVRNGIKYLINPKEIPKNHCVPGMSKFITSSANLDPRTLPKDDATSEYWKEIGS